MKTRMYVAFATLFLLASSSAALAASGTALESEGISTSTTGPTIAGGSTATIAENSDTAIVLGRLSKGVVMGVNFDDTAYALTTKHAGGTNMYGTAYDSTSMFMLGGNPEMAAPESSDNSSFLASAGWTAM